jgi:hypothetical protein
MKGGSGSFSYNELAGGTKGVLRSMGAAAPASADTHESASEGEEFTSGGVEQLQKKVEIAGGSALNQDVGVDPKDIDYWCSEPAGLIYVNTVFGDELERILSGRKREEKEKGSLNGLRVGN